MRTASLRPLATATDLYSMVHAGVQRGGKGGVIPRAPSHYGGAKSLRGVPNGCEVAENSQQCHNYFFQYSTLASERSQSRTLGGQTCFLSRPLSNLVTTLGVRNCESSLMQLWKCFTVSPFRSACLAMHQTTMKTKGRQLQRACKTRWLSSEATVRARSEISALGRTKAAVRK